MARTSEADGHEPKVRYLPEAEVAHQRADGCSWAASAYGLQIQDVHRPPRAVVRLTELTDGCNCFSQLSALADGPVVVQAYGLAFPSNDGVIVR